MRIDSVSPAMLCLALILGACGEEEQADTGGLPPGGGGGSTDGGAADGGAADGGSEDGGSEDGGSEDGGSATSSCPDFFPADREGIAWTYLTEHDDGRAVSWTQEVLPQQDGQFVLQTVIDGSTTDLYYTCDGSGAVELHGGSSAASAYSTTYSYSPPMLVWPGGEATSETSWYSAGSQSGTWTAGGASGSMSGSYSSTWTVTAVDTTYDLPDGTTLEDCFTYTRSASTEVAGTTTGTEELGIYCGSLYGLVWTDVVTTTDTGHGPAAVAESRTSLTGLRTD